VVNFHHSYKLKYKGRHCATWAIRNNEIFHGSTMHFIDENVDEGKIIDTDKFKIEKHHTAEDIFFLANETGLDLLKNNFKKTLNQQGFNFKEQDLNSFTYRRRDLSHEISHDHIIDKNSFLKEVRSLTFSNKPAPFIVIDNQKIYLKLESYDTGFLAEKKDETRN
jgi:methionyl-tRNA formyltransferase